VLAKFDDDSPALAQVAVGKGNLLVLASGWNPADSQLAVSSKFPPLLQTMLDWSGASAPARFQFAPATPSRASSTNEQVANGKTGGKPTLQPGAAILGDGRREFTTPLRGGQERLFAVNIPLEESRTAPISQDELARLGVPLGWDSQAGRRVARVHQQHLQDAELENRQKLWRWLIVAALAVTFGEIVLSGWLARRVTTAGATFMMEPRLKNELAAAELTLRRARLWRELRFCWLGGRAGRSLLLLQGFSGWTSPAPLDRARCWGGIIATGVVWQRHVNGERLISPRSSRPSSANIPNLRHLLSAAAEQEPGGRLQVSAIARGR
jgi:hypothetical protein